VTISGVLTVAGAECAKLVRQLKVRIVLAACMVGPFAFAAAMTVQSALPEDTLFGRAVKQSGFAIPLVVLGFAALWAFPGLTSVVGGDLFSAEDRYGTWKTVLTRSRSRTEIFWGKVLTAFGFSTLSVTILGVSSMAAGVLVVGAQPLINLSGIVLSPDAAFGRVTLAWVSVLPPVFGFTALSVLVSVATRSGAAGIGLPIIVGLMMQGYAFVDGPEVVRRLLIASAFDAWHGILTEPTFHRPLIYGAIASGMCFVVCLTLAYRLLQSRDIGG
jgi:ABC-2 type transport system permease protein